MLTQKPDGFIFGLGGPLHSFFRDRMKLSFMFSIHDLSVVLVTFPPCDSIPGGRNLKAERISFSSQFEGLQAVMGGKTRWWEGPTVAISGSVMWRGSLPQPSRHR